MELQLQIKIFLANITDSDTSYEPVKVLS